MDVLYALHVCALGTSPVTSYSGVKLVYTSTLNSSARSMAACTDHTVESLYTGHQIHSKIDRYSVKPVYRIPVAGTFG